MWDFGGSFKATNFFVLEIWFSDSDLKLLKMTVIDENFPAGMRVLAVDDDPTCLKLLETLLRKCNYNGLVFFF